jgi:signal transduction histidine kinase
MSKRKTEIDAAELRRRAESMTQWLLAHPLQGEADAQKLLHELQVYQVELEMQNTELRLAQDETAATLRQINLRNEGLEKSSRDSSASGDKTEASIRAENAMLVKMCAEMRTPLKVITDMSRQIRRLGADTTQAKCLDKLDAATLQLLKIFDAAVDPSKRAPG